MKLVNINLTSEHEGSHACGTWKKYANRQGAEPQQRRGKACKKTRCLGSNTHECYTKKLLFDDVLKSVNSTKTSGMQHMNMTLHLQMRPSKI
jgi:hypothetical protein